jgi:DNA-binding GntR family transcriptional regulator
MSKAYEGQYASVVLEWERVAQSIKDQIATGELRRGDKLPSEPALAAEYEVSYSTVRRAMKDLREHGLIESIWGKGTFVASETPRQPGG